MSLIEYLPKVRGDYKQNVELSRTNWFGVGGPAEVLFKPEDAEDLAFFIANKPEDVPVVVIGVGSNLLVRDGGIKGVVVKLGRAFTKMEVKGNNISAGAGALNYNLANFAKDCGKSGLEFIIGIPGTVGGGLAMNAGAYGSDVSSVLVYAEAIDDYGDMHQLSVADMGFIYRGNNVPENWIFTKAVYKMSNLEPAIIQATMDDIMAKRAATQPVKTRTCGSTFANPPGNLKAWQLIEQAGCRNLRVGGASISDLHCNFMVNDNNASAADIENLGEEVRRKVFETSGVSLEWEIRRVGVALEA